VIDLRFRLALLLGQVLQFFLRLAPYWGGGAAPGLLALTIDPEFISKQKKNFKLHILVSGTNGKTTTTRMTSALLSAQKIPHIHNRSGSNLLRGIASALIAGQKIKKKEKNLIGLWEVDEAVLPYAIDQLKPQMVVLTNLFRDQLDRYGEIDTLAKKWLNSLKTLPEKSRVILNGDDATLVSLGKKLNNSLFFGIEKLKNGETKPAHAADATFCPKCLRPLDYRQVYYSHLGSFSCTCGFCQAGKTISAMQIKQTGKSLSFVCRLKSKSLKINLPIIGLFNVYNCLAALALAKLLKLNLEAVPQTLVEFKPAFGRMETIKVDHKTINLLLVKNPTGFNQVITTLIRKKSLPVLVIAINDKLADGTDVSWLWDVNFEALKGKSNNIIVTGTRARDMALRLKYAGIDLKNLSLITTNLKKALAEAVKSQAEQIYLLPTYTVMLEMRNIFRQWEITHSSWED